jgi:hypothetical protein
MTAALGFFVLAAAAQAEERLQEISWTDLQQRHATLPGPVRPAGASAPFACLELAHPEAGARAFTLLTLDRPPITKVRYAVVGDVRYEGLEGTGFLEMWSTFPGKGSFFTRTLAVSGPMQSLSGSSPWRPFVLPFDSTGAGAPEKLVVNVALPGRGTVWVGPLRLVQYADNEAQTGAGGAWWGPRAAGRLGGIVGSLFGGAGAVIGLLAGRGKARAIVLGLLKGMLALGAAALVLGVVAMARAQPYDVTYPLLLVGVLGVALPWWQIPVLRRRYEALELRKMTARDA